MSIDKSGARKRNQFRRVQLSILLLSLISLQLVAGPRRRSPQADIFPDGTTVPEWFHTPDPVILDSLGPKFVLTEYGIFADGNLHTEQIQALIDKAAAQGGGVIVVPAGLYRTGALHFKPRTHLHLMQGAILQGSDFIGDYPLDTTRIEGETCLYFGALINADHVDGFTISGSGTIDGNGLRFHQAFWLRRRWNRNCLNKDEQRPRLLYVSNSCDVRIQDVRLQNSPYWTSHFYRCENLRICGVSFFSLGSPDDSMGPSTDAIDLDVVRNVHISHCHMEVNDDAISMKGGKGPWADDQVRCPGNGANENIIIEDCTYGFCHSCLTLGSESVSNHNIIMRRISVDGAYNLLWLKMRPDTPQLYRYVTVEQCQGFVHNFIYVRPWTQFYDLKDRADLPISYADHITMRDCEMSCNQFFNVESSPEEFRLSDFRFERLSIEALKDKSFDSSLVEGFQIRDVIIR